MIDRENFLKNVGSRIKEARKTMKFSQQELATKIGSHQAEVSRWENGNRQNRNVCLFRLVKIAKALDKSIDYFVS